MPDYGDSFNSRTMGKIIQADYDTAIGLNDECQVCLTKGQVNALLAIIEYFGWATRWYSYTQPIDTTEIKNFRDDLVRRLINVCCCGDNGSQDNEPRDYFVRIDSDGFQETSDDNGGTWSRNTDSDYRFNGGVFPRPDAATLGDDPTCTYTLNLLAQIERMQQAYNANWEIGDNLTELIAAIVAALSVYGLVLTGLLPTLLITAIVVSILAIGRVAWNAAFTEGFYSELKCAIKDNMPSNGVWSPTSWSALLVSVDAMTFSIARIWTWNLLRAMGSVGLSNASAVPAFSEDTCDECGDGWCVDDNFADAQYDWAPRLAGGHDYASWAGTYFDAVTLTWNSPPANDDSSVQIEKTGSGFMDTMNIFFTGSPNTFEIEFYLASVLQYTHTLTGYISGDPFGFDSVEFDMVRVVLYNTSGGGMTVSRVVMGGVGAAPFDGGACE